VTTTRTMISIKEAARRLDIDTRVVYRLIDRGLLPPFKGERGLIVVPEDAVSSLERAKG
jgi:excisionase family DNA binding protein